MDELNYILLGKILSGEASEQEQKEFESWVKKSLRNKHTYENYRKFWYQAEISEEIPSLNETLAKGRRLPTKLNSENLFLRYRTHFVAASVIFLLVSSMLAISSILKVDPDTNDDFAVSLVKKYNPKGQKSKIMLPDGSTVWLNSESEISYIENSFDTLREVSLLGEAFFEVVSDSIHPFKVSVDKYEVQVLGTSFNINAFHERPEIQVALASGKLKVSGVGTASTYLNPGQMAACKKENIRIDTSSCSIEGIADWKNGILNFKNEKITSIIQTLERWYGVHFSIIGEIDPEWRFNGYFKNEYLRNILEVMIHGKNLEYKLDGKNVTLIIK